VGGGINSDSRTCAAESISCVSDATGAREAAWSVAAVSKGTANSTV